MFLFNYASGTTCFVAFIGAAWIVMLVSAIARAMAARRRTKANVEDERVCPDEKCESHNPPYSRFCRRCGAALRDDGRRTIGSGLNEDSR